MQVRLGFLFGVLHWLVKMGLGFLSNVLIGASWVGVSLRCFDCCWLSCDSIPVSGHYPVASAGCVGFLSYSERR